MNSFTKNNTSNFFLTSDTWPLPNIDEVECFECQFDVNAYNDSLYEYVNILHPIPIQRAINKRKAEFLAGRYVAQQALSSLGMFEHNINIGNHRSPTWPDNYIGSITHSNEIAICAVVRKNHYIALGIDIEECLEMSFINEIIHTIIDSEEQQLLKNSPMKFIEAVTIAFSGKESLFKALYPLVGEYFDFKAVKIIKIALELGKMTFQIQEKLSAEFTVGVNIEGHFLIRAGASKTMIFTYVALPII